MKTLIVPDIHHKIERAQNIIEKHPEVDRRVFLGDYFDDFGDEYDMDISRRTAKWLRKTLEDPKNICLAGNHDLAYMYPHLTGLGCSGYTKDKSKVINSIMGNYWDQLGFYAWVGEFLVSHAGVSPLFVPKLSELAEYMAGAILELQNNIINPIFEAGQARGGWHQAGGIVWQDWNEEFISNSSPQIVGHTPIKEPCVNVYGDWNLDTHLRHYAIIDDGEIVIYGATSIE